MADAFDFQVERFVELERFRERGSGFAEAAFPFREARISALNPGEVFLPLIHGGKEVAQVPLVGFGYLGAGRCRRFAHARVYTMTGRAWQRARTFALAKWRPVARRAFRG